MVNDLSIVATETAQPAEDEQAQTNANEKDSNDDQVTPTSYNPLREQQQEQDATPAAQPQLQTKPSQRLTLVKRLEAALAARKSKKQPQQESLQTLPIREDAHTYADRQLPYSDAPSAVQQVADEEPQEQPRQLTMARPPKPMGGYPVRMAMQQGPRGPQAPNGGPMPMYSAANQAGAAPARYDQPCMPNYAWPSYAAYPNYAAVTYPKQYSPTAWPYIGPFYPYPQVPLGWRKVTLEWDDGWWFLDFKDQPASCWQR